MFDKNSKLRKVMLTTTIIGLVTTMLFVIIVDMGYWELLLWHWAYYFVFPFLIVCFGFRWKFGKQTYWITTLCFSPFLVEVFGTIITNSLIFTKWYSIIGITISVLIFEYKFFSHDKKCK